MEKIEKTPLEPSLPKMTHTMFEGRRVECELFNVREFGGIQEYVIIRAPNTREFTRFTIEKRRLHPIKDGYSDQPKWLRGQF